MATHSAFHPACPPPLVVVAASWGNEYFAQTLSQTEFEFFKSLQQTMLSRQLCKYATESSEARRLLLYMATSKAPDELYFPTLTQMDERFKSM